MVPQHPAVYVMAHDYRAHAEQIAAEYQGPGSTITDEARLLQGILSALLALAEGVSSAGARKLSASDPEPPEGTLVRDDCGVVWLNDGHRPCCWVRPDADVHAPETWTKIAGNYGPVTVLARDPRS